MDSVTRSVIFLQFVLCLPSLLAECSLVGLRLRVLKVALFTVMTTLLLSGYCLLEILGIGLVLLNFCMLYGRRNRYHICHNQRRFCLATLTFSLVFLCGKIVLYGVFESETQKSHQGIDCSRSRMYSMSDAEDVMDRYDYEKRALMAYQLVARKDVHNVSMKRLNETATNIEFEVMASGSSHYDINVRKDCDKVFVEELLADSLTNNVHRL